MTMDGQDVTKMVGENTDLRWEYQTKRDERLFRASWYVDFRARWKADLEREHQQFRSRMEAIG
jgi:hypothetical protein